MVARRSLDSASGSPLRSQDGQVPTIRIPRILGAHSPTRECTHEFTIGKPPVLPTIEQYNNTLPVLGGPENEARLKKLIKDTIKPKPIDPKPLPPDLKRVLQWSEPVNGLAARIEEAFLRTILVRLRNVSQESLVVPTGNPGNETAPQAFEIYARKDVGPWRRATPQSHRYCEQASPEEDERRAYLTRFVRGIEIDRPPVTLRPGEHCLAMVQTLYEEDTEFKVVLRCPETNEPGRWSAVLETPPRRILRTYEDSLPFLGKLPMPEHFPTLNYDAYSPSGSEPAVGGLWLRNGALIQVLRFYMESQVRVEFERRMVDEKKMPMKLLLAVIAAQAGSEKAALHLLEMAKSTDFRTTVNVHAALALLFPYPETDVPGWLAELSTAILADERFRTGLQGTDSEGECFTIQSYDLGTPLLWELAAAKYQKAVPILLNWARKGHWDAIVALSDMGDERAVPLLIELVQGGHFRAVAALGRTGDRRAIPILIEVSKDPRLGSEAVMALADIDAKRAVPLLVQMFEGIKPTAIESKHRYAIQKLAEIDAERAKPVLVKLLRTLPRSHVDLNYGRLSEPLYTLAEVAGQLKAKEAVPTLLQYVEYPEIMEALAEIGDPAAIPSLQKTMDEDARIVERHQELPAEFAKKRLFAARMALCTWDTDGGTERLLELLGDESLDEWQYATVVSKLAECQTPKAIPALVGVIQVGQGHSAIAAALSGLAKLKHKAAVEGLIDCFDVDFKEESFNKGGHVTPATYRNRIAQALQKLTGQPFGTDKQQWLQWWQQQGQHDPNLK